MKIKDVHIHGFGVWSDLAMDGLGGDVTVFYGPNEAGKTTLMQFMRTVLYGFSPERRARYLPPVSGGRAGGSLRISTSRGEYDVIRRSGLHDPIESLGEVQLLDEDGAPQSSHTLSSLLGGVDESIFTNVFAIGLKEIQELSALNDSAAAEHLYKLTSGLDRVSLVDVVRELNTSRTRLLSVDSGTGVLPLLVAKREKLTAEVEELATRSRRWPQLMAERADLGREIEQLDHAIADLQRQLQSYDLVLQAKDKWGARRQIDEQLAVLGVSADVPPDAVEQLDELNRRLRKLRGRRKSLIKQRAQLQQELAEHEYHRGVIMQASRIQALHEHAPWIGSLETEVERLQHETANLEREIEARRPQLDVPAGAKSRLPEITPKTLSLLREPATRLNQLSRQISRVEQEAQAVKSRSEQVLQRVTTELQDLDESSLSAALEKAGTRVAQLRRRIQVEERLEQLQMQHNDLNGENDELFEFQVMPFDKMVWLFIAFVVFTVMALGGIGGTFLWGLSPYQSLLLTFIGVVGLGGSIVWKLDWERNAERQLQSSERQLELLDTQIAETRAERDEIDAQLPPGGGPLDARLAQAERQLQHLEQLAPMDAARHESGQHVDAAERRAAKAAEDLRDARKNWQSALRTAGLPETLGPNDVRQLARGFHQVATVRRQWEQKRDELETRRRELGSLSVRVEEIFAELGLKPDSPSAQAQLKQLFSALTEQQKIVQRRQGLLEKFKELRGRWSKCLRLLEAVVKARKSLLSKANAQDENQLRMMVMRLQQAVSLRSQRDELSQQIRLIVGEHWTEDLLARELAGRDDQSPEQRKQRLGERLNDTRARLHDIHEQRGQLAAEMKTMVADRRLAEAKLELSVVEEQIVAAARRWQTLAVTGLLLESVRGIYETTRQPETLREASTYLQRLTQGLYVRVWTPIEDAMLKVDDSKGQSISMDKLSSGTREAVFLALRLALVAGYARRGATLPLILDDVLVNFDTARVRATAAVLRDFARQGHQLLLFTCHEHIMRIFREVQAQVRLLPGRDAVIEEVVPVAAPEVKKAPEPPKKAPEPPKKAPEPPPAPVIVVETPPEPRRRRAERRPERRPAKAERIVSVIPLKEDPTPAVLLAEPDEDYQLADEEPTLTTVVLPPPPEPIEEAPEPEPAPPPPPPPPPPRKESAAAKAKRQYERRFTWESPEMYWRDEDEAAA